MFFAVYLDTAKENGYNVIKIQKEVAMNIKYPENVEKIINILQSHGYSAYAVGGCVRDTLMGRVPADWDITTSCKPQMTLEIFDSLGIKTIPTGLKHGTVSVLLDGEIYECTTYRIDGEYTDARHPNSVTFTDKLRDDLSRRDFTVNAMAMAGDELCDFFGGLDDLRSRVIRCVGDPYLRFREDALRILRALRFATVLGFSIEENTLSAINELAHTLVAVSSERRTEEFKKILLSDNPNKGVELLFGTDVIKYILPDASVLPTNLGRVRADFSLRLGELLYLSGARDLSKLRLSNKEHKTVSLATEKIPFPDTDEGARRTLAKYGELSRDVCVIQDRNALAGLLLKPEILSAPVSISALSLGGDDLISMGIPPKNVGKALSFLLEKVLSDPSLNTADSLSQILKANFGA